MAKWIDFKRLKKELPFATVLSHYNIQHNPNKTQDTVACPFHDDSEPSCSINKDKGIFRCFGCDTSGNVLDFVCEMEGLEPENAKELARGAEIAIGDILGLELSDFGRKDKAASKRKKKPPPAKKATRAKSKPAKTSKEDEAIDKPVPEAEEIKANAALAFELQNLVKEHAFFDRCGISRDTVETFGLGLCERGILKAFQLLPHSDMNCPSSKQSLLRHMPTEPCCCLTVMKLVGWEPKKLPCFCPDMSTPAVSFSRREKNRTHWISKNRMFFDITFDPASWQGFSLPVSQPVVAHAHLAITEMW